jgi:hypothetical protein
MNGRPVPFKVQANGEDKHVSVRFPVNGGPNTLVIRVKHDFGISLSNDLPALGSASRGLRVVSESWNSADTQLTLNVSGLQSTHYELSVWNPGEINSVQGARLNKQAKLEIQIPQAEDGAYVSQKIVLQFGRP